MEKISLLPLKLQFFAEEELSENNAEVAEQQEMAEDTAEVEAQGDVAEETSEEQTANDEHTPATVQSAEDNAKAAAARRQAEREFAERQRQTDAYYATKFAGYENPITHQPIKSEKDYRDALEAQDIVNQNKQLEEKGIDPNLISQIVNKQVENNPVVKQAQQITQQIQQEQANKMLEADLSEISKLDQNIKSFEDIANLPNIADIVALTNQGMNLSTAFKVANLDNLIQGKSAAVKQATINNLKGTQHLNATNSVSVNEGSEVDIPQALLGMWKESFPDKSPSELKKLYNQSI